MQRAALAMMFLSGASALIYELVWMRMLVRAFGITVHAVCALVSLYMGGLALGAAVSARRLGRRDWMRVYAWLEAGAGLAALACTGLMRELPRLIASLAADAPPSTALRLALAAPLLLPPTALLGATLPVMARWWTTDAASEAKDRTQGMVGRLYGANTLGAALGLLLAGFWTIGQWGESASVALAAALNLAAALLAFAFSVRRNSAPPTPVAAAPGRLPRRARFALTLFAASGFCCLGYEILWARQLVLLLGNSTYAFSAILTVYLLGTALGSRFSTWVANESVEPLATFGLIELLLAVCIGASLAEFRVLGMALNTPEYLFSLLVSRWDFALLALQAAVMVGPAAFVMGLLFPLAARLCSDGGAEDGAALGRAYSWNTVGGIAGSMAAGFWGIAHFGAHGTFLALAGLNAAVGLAALAAAGSLRPGRIDVRAVVLLASLVALGLFVRKDPTLDILKGRLRRGFGSSFQILFHDESPAAAITGVSMGGTKALLVNGIHTAGSGADGTAMAVLPDLFVAKPRAALIVCFGAGNTFRAASLLAGADPARRVDAVELVADIPRRMPAFYDDAAQHLEAPGRRVIIDDGRQFLLRSRSHYDYIIVDAAPPLYSAGTVNLYAREFLQLARARLTPGGVFALWLPLYSFEDDYWRIMRAMADVFPHVALWSKPSMSGMLVFGSQEEFSWPRGELDRRLAARGSAALAGGLREAEIRSGFVAGEQRLREKLAGYQPVTDDLPSTEFPLPRFLRGEKLMVDTKFLDGLRKQRARP